MIDDKNLFVHLLVISVFVRIYMFSTKKLHLSMNTEIRLRVSPTINSHLQGAPKRTNTYIYSVSTQLCLLSIVKYTVPV
jgi:hypothetical protein